MIQRLAAPAFLWTRRLVAPALLVALCGAMFGQAFEPADLVIATVVSVLLGGCVGWLAAMREHLMSGAASIVVPVAALIVAAVVGVSVVGETWFGVGTTADAMTTFLLVGLPAPGLGSLSIVVFVVLFPTMVATTWASARQRTLATITPPTLAVGAIGLLVAPVGSAWWVPVLVAAVCGAVLMVDVRNDLASIPPLVGSGTELRRQLTWWRPVVQVVPALVAVVLFGAVVPTASTFDIRQFVHPTTIRVEDPSPLAVAARWRDLDSSEPSARVTVDGAAPGRIRVAVLDDYNETGWEQAADYGVTGDRFAADPIYPDGPVRTARSLMTVERREEAGFRAMPTAGIPERTDDPADIRYSPEAGTIYAADGGRQVQYTAAPTATAPPVVEEPLVSEFPAELATCPPSEPLRSVATQLTAGLVSASGRLGRIEDWLLTRRIYDPSAPGGQTLGSVEQFLSQPYARGNLEVFVTTYALLARCAGIPVRVVVGYPAPAPGTTDYGQHDITAWVETPLALSGWAPFDPVPTPAEQERLAQLAQQPTPDPAQPPTVDGAPPQQVETSNLPGSGFPWSWVIVAAVVLAIVAAWTFLLPLLIRSRRQKVADPADAVLAAWSTVCDELTDRNVGLAPNLTPGEVVSVCSASMPISVPGLVSGIAPMVDRVRYSGVPGTPEDAGVAWGHVEALDERLPTTWATRLTALRHPIRQIRRLGSTIGVARQAGRWRAELPDTAVISSAEAPSDIPEVGIDARIGDGSTGTVYRGVFVPTGEAVAVKVFRYGPNDPGFDGNRFDWEVRIAREVSGLPNLPVTFDAGITPTTGRPYMVSTLYRKGTLLDHVRRGGLMTTAEAVAIGGDLAVALEALHQLGVIHADVKPENVFASDGGWVLGDLGSAWLRTARGPAASLTPPYAAPEVWRGGSPTPEADIYSLGLTMLFARTGSVPIAGNPPAPDDVVAAFPDLPIVLRARPRPTPAAPERRGPRSCAAPGILHRGRRGPGADAQPAHPDGHPLPRLIHSVAAPDDDGSMTASNPVRTVTIEERRARLALRHRLAPSARIDDDVAAIADALVALHSSDPVSVYLSAMARMAAPSLESVDAALYDERSILRFHAMRRTLWVTTRELARAADASSTLKLLAPEHARFVKMLAANGITDGDRWIAEAKEQTLAELHRRGEATARELGLAVPALRHPMVLAPGKSYSTTQGAHTRVLQHLGFDGSIVRSRPVGSWVNSQYRWASMADWIPGGITGMDPSDASATLVDRWLRRFGPGTTADVQWWTGWNGRDTKQAITAAGAVPVEVEVGPGRVEPGWLAGEDTAAVSCDEAWVALVPGLDPTTMGWKARDWYLDPTDAPRLFDPNGNGGPAIWIDGRIVGSWVPRPDGTIASGWFGSVAARRRRQVETVARRLEALIDRTFTVRFPASIQSVLLGS